MDVINLAGIEPTEVTKLQHEVDPLRTLADLLDWSRRLTPPVLSPAVVAQDEYTHDVLIPYTGGRWLDFDTT
jgi:hypothetical protein